MGTEFPQFDSLLSELKTDVPGLEIEYPGYDSVAIEWKHIYRIGNKK